MLLTLVAAGGACSLGGDTQGEAGDRRAPLTAGEPRVMLAELTLVQVVSGGVAGSLVTPRWRPDGHGIVASGYLGRGLYEVDVRDGSVQELIREVAAGRSLVFRPDGGAAAVPAAEDGRYLEITLSPQPSAEVVPRPHYVPVPERLNGARSDGVALWRGRAERVVFEPLRGRVARMGGGGEEVIVEEGAWGVTVSADGSRIAYSVGHLTDGHLLVHERGAGTRDMGPGVHPSWLPDGRHLVFAVPEAAVDLAGQASLVGAELFLTDVATGRDVQLTATDGVTEMEPAVSPDGATVAFADWHSGALCWSRLEVGTPDRGRP